MCISLLIPPEKFNFFILLTILLAISSEVMFLALNLQQAHSTRGPCIRTPTTGLGLGSCPHWVNGENRITILLGDSRDVNGCIITFKTLLRVRMMILRIAMTFLSCKAATALGANTAPTAYY